MEREKEWENEKLRGRENRKKRGNMERKRGESS